MLVSNVKFTSNLDKVLKEIEKRANDVSGQVSFDKLFTPSFMNRYTDFSSLDELFKAGNYEVNNEEDFKAIPDDEFDLLISKTTKFENWKEMQETAAVEYVKKGLKL